VRWNFSEIFRECRREDSLWSHKFLWSLELRKNIRVKFSQIWSGGPKTQGGPWTRRGGGAQQAVNFGDEAQFSTFGGPCSKIGGYLDPKTIPREVPWRALIISVNISYVYLTDFEFIWNGTLKKKTEIEVQTHFLKVRRAIEFSVFGWDDHFPLYLGDCHK